MASPAGAGRTRGPGQYHGITDPSATSEMAAMTRATEHCWKRFFVILEYLIIHREVLENAHLHLWQLLSYCKTVTLNAEAERTVISNQAD